MPTDRDQPISVGMVAGRTIVLPTHRVVGIVIFLGPMGELQGTKSVYHNCQFVSEFFAYRRLRRARVWAVRDTMWMECKRSYINATPAHEVTVHIVDNFFAINIRVVIGSGDRERVIVVLARHEGTDHEVMRLERLVDGRRLVDSPRYRLEISNVKDVRVEVAVPANDIEGVVVVVVGREHVVGAYAAP